jgi:hypothetical protein
MRWIGVTLMVMASAGPAVRAQAPAGSGAAIALGARHGHAVPTRQGFTHTGGGNIDVAQPAPDTIVVTMAGVAVAGAHPCKYSLAQFQFDLEQNLDVVLLGKATKAKLIVDARLIGLLRSHRHGGGSAEHAQACAALLEDKATVFNLCLPAHGVARGENLAINCREGPAEFPVRPGHHVLRQSFLIQASHPQCVFPFKAASAEFAPDPALDPLWISAWEPFHGANKKDFGFQVTIKVAGE